MAKGQQRSNREIKKPKAAKKPEVAAPDTRHQIPVKISGPKDRGK